MRADLGPSNWANTKSHVYGKYCKISNTNVSYQDWNAQNACQNSKQAKPDDQTVSEEAV